MSAPAATPQACVTELAVPEPVTVLQALHSHMLDRARTRTGGRAVSPDMPVPFYPAYLPTARTIPAIPYRLTPLAEAVLDQPAPELEAEP